MTEPIQLTLSEKTLLALLTPEGRWKPDSTFGSYGVACAVLCELILAGAVEYDGRRVRAIEPRPELKTAALGAYEMIAGRRAQAVLSTVHALVKHDVAELVIAGLEAQGVLGRGERKVIGLFPVSTHPERDPMPEAAFRTAVQHALDTGEVSDQDIPIVVTILDKLGLLKDQFGRVSKERKRELLAQADSAGDSVKDTANQAMMMLVVFAAVAGAVGGGAGAAS